jgi:hypothetical protein
VLDLALGFPDVGYSRNVSYDDLGFPDVGYSRNVSYDEHYVTLTYVLHGGKLAIASGQSDRMVMIVNF